MSAVIAAAGMEPWDVHMSDLLQGKITLDQFSGIVFVGGFSYADVLDSGEWTSTQVYAPSLPLSLSPSLSPSPPLSLPLSLFHPSFPPLLVFSSASPPSSSTLSPIRFTERK